jgi:hypothetical protein
MLISIIRTLHSDKGTAVYTEWGRIVVHLGFSFGNTSTEVKRIKIFAWKHELHIAPNIATIWPIN